MNEGTARGQVESIVGTAPMATLARFVAMLVEENDRQNLIARSTAASIWSRHILDSVQLLRWAGDGAPWIDIGTGAGFPGLAIAIADPRPMLLVEPRRRRAAFLADAADRLGLNHVTVICSRIEEVSACAGVISARAVAPVEKLLQAAASCATAGTRWLFLRGRLLDGEVGGWRRSTGMMFHVEQSLSRFDSSVVICETPR